MSIKTSVFRFNFSLLLKTNFQEFGMILKHKHAEYGHAQIFFVDITNNYIITNNTMYQSMTLG